MRFIDNRGDLVNIETITEISKPVVVSTGNNHWTGYIDIYTNGRMYGNNVIRLCYTSVNEQNALDGIEKRKEHLVNFMINDDLKGIILKLSDYEEKR